MEYNQCDREIKEEKQYGRNVARGMTTERTEQREKKTGREKYQCGTSVIGTRSARKMFNE